MVHRIALGSLLFISNGLAIANINNLDPRFEKYSGGSEAVEQSYVETLKKAFAHIQAAGATEGRLHRGTHAKGICALGSFEVYEPQNEEAKEGLFAAASQSPARVRFANGAGKIQSDLEPDARSLSVAVFSKYGRQDFSMNNGPVFPIPNLEDFVLQVSFGPARAQIAAAVEAAGVTGDLAAQEIDNRLKAMFGDDYQQRLLRIQKLGQELAQKQVWSYQTQAYWSGTAFKFGKDRVAKFKFLPCDGDVRAEVPRDAGEDYLQTAVKDAEGDICFEAYLQLLDPEAMRDQSGNRLEAWQWVEDAGLDWDAAGATYLPEPLAKLKIYPNTVFAPDDCDDVRNSINVVKHALPSHQALGSINRGRSAVEQQSQENRGK